jgi:nucleoside-diphosphate-sugar epimerase
MNVFVPGGCGYVGAMLVPHLLAARHRVTVLDTQWFGDGHLPDNDNLRTIRGDIRDHKGYWSACEDQDAVIFLASVSNNDLCIQQPELALDVNLRIFPRCVQAARARGVKRFIYASSVAAYGSTEHDATEEVPLNPTTPYAHAKAQCEAVLLDHCVPEWTIAITRSASVCGYSLRQRFDLTVNKMVHDAIRNGHIGVNGGTQKRCHVHVRDLCSAYQLLLDAPKETIDGQAFNIVSENQTVADTAKIVSEETGAEITLAQATDSRSYTVDGSKAQKALGFTPLKTVRHAARDLKTRLDAGYWQDSKYNPAYQNMAYGLA